VLLLAACEADCPAPSDVDGAWRMTAVVLEHQGGDDPGFPSYHSPANGEHTWDITWTGTELGPVEVSLDTRPTTAEGVWDTTACGAFSLDVSGTHEGPTGTTHVYQAVLSLVLWDDTVDGSYDWTEDWTSRDAQHTGTFTATGWMEGRRP